jgi:hypothetical protein
VARLGRPSLPAGSARLGPAPVLFVSSLGSLSIGCVLDLDGLQAALGDAQSKCAFGVVPAPDRQFAAGPDLFNESFGQELGHDLMGGSALQVRRKLDGTILALRCRGQQHQLGVGEFHFGSLFG